MLQIYWFLRDVRIRTQRATAASRRATYLVATSHTNLYNYIKWPACPIICGSGMIAGGRLARGQVKSANCILETRSFISGNIEWVRWPGSLAVIWFGSPPPSLTWAICLSSSVFLCVAGQSYLRAMGRRGCGRSLIRKVAIYGELGLQGVLVKVAKASRRTAQPWLTAAQLWW